MMPVDSKRILENLVIAVASSIILTLLALAWNWASSGGVIRLLGGVTLDQVKLEIALRGPATPVPRGAVVAFNSNVCPTGWSRTTEAGNPIVTNQGGIIDADIPQNVAMLYGTNLDITKGAASASGRLQLKAYLYCVRL